MKQNQVDVPSAFIDPKWVSKGSLDRRTAGCPFELRESFVNNLGKPVTLLLRNGMKIVLPPEPDLEGRNTFLCRVTLSFRSKTYRDTANFFQGLDERKISKELAAIRDAFNVKIKTNFHRGGDVVLDYEMTMSQLVGHGGTVYFSEIDAVISIEPPNEGINHPDSEEGRKQRVVRDAMKGAPNVGFTYSIVFIDSTGTYGTRYTRINSEVFKVVPVQDHTKRDGIYIVSRNSLNPDLTDQEFYNTFYELSEIDDAGFYRTRDEAAHFGDTEAAHARDMAELRMTTERLKTERVESEQRAKLEQIAREEEKQVLLAKLEDAEREKERVRAERAYQDDQRRAKMKDHYEERSHVRKDQSEGLKFLPTVLIGLGTLAAFLWKGVSL